MLLGHDCATTTCFYRRGAAAVAVRRFRAKEHTSSISHCFTAGQFKVLSVITINPVTRNPVDGNV